MKPIPKSKSKSRVVESPDEEEHSELGDGEDSMYVDDEPPEVKRKKPRKKAEKKAVVVGKNGLRKKRVMKSRVSLDEKGYRGRFRFRSLRMLTLKAVPSSDRGLLLIRVR